MESTQERITIKKASELTKLNYMVIRKAILRGDLPAYRPAKEYFIEIEDLYKWANKKFEPRGAVNKKE